MDLIIRALTHQDLERHREFRLKALKSDPDVFGTKYSELVAEPLQFWKKFTPGSFIALESGKVIGIIYSFKRKSGHAGITGLWVEPQYRGKGVASALMNTVINLLKESKFKKVTLWNTENNEKAQNLYHKLGFKPSGKVALLKSNPRIKIYHLVKEL